MTPHPHDYPARHIHLDTASTDWESRWLPFAQPADRVFHQLVGGWVTHPADQPCVECET